MTDSTRGPFAYEYQKDLTNDFNYYVLAKTLRDIFGKTGILAGKASILLSSATLLRVGGNI